MDFYLLDENKQPYKVSLEESYKIYQDPNMKIVQQDKLDNGLFVSTVFLGMDHSWDQSLNHKPVLWETMIFDGKDEYQERYTSYEDAVEGHKKALEIAKLYDKSNISTENNN